MCHEHIPFLVLPVSRVFFFFSVFFKEIARGISLNVIYFAGRDTADNCRLEKLSTANDLCYCATVFTVFFGIN